MIVRVSSEVLTGILNDEAGALQAVGEVSALPGRSPPGKVHPVDFGGELGEALLREGSEQVTDILAEQGQERGARGEGGWRGGKGFDTPMVR